MSFYDRADEAPLRELLRRFTYRPGWKFHIEGGTLYIEAEVIDANDQGRVCPLHFRRHLPPPLFNGDTFEWQHWLLDVIKEVEWHEAREFFQVDGVKVFDPHAND